jgi:hypothetical protein
MPCTTIWLFQERMWSGICKSNRIHRHSDVVIHVNFSGGKNYEQKGIGNRIGCKHGGINARWFHHTG